MGASSLVPGFVRAWIGGRFAPGSAALPAEVAPALVRRTEWLPAWVIWLVAGVIVGALAGRAPDKATVTTVYWTSGEAWLHGQPLYTEVDDAFISLPQSAVVMVPWAMLPRPAAEFLWRLAGAGLMGAAVWVCGKRYSAPTRFRDFNLACTLLVLAVGVGTLRNGQINLHLSALFCLAFAWMMGPPGKQRLGWAAAALCLAFVLKPIAMVPILLAGVIVPGMWWRLAVGMVVVALLPLLHTDTAYAIGQYKAGVQMVLKASQPYRANFADLYGMLLRLGWDVPTSKLMYVRLAAAAVTGAAGLVAFVRFDRMRGVLMLSLLAGTYLMFGNPRTEGVSYVIMAAPVAFVACLTLQRRIGSVVGWGLVVCCILLASAHAITPPKDYVIRPALAIIVWGWALVQCGWGQFLPSEAGERRPVNL